MSRRKDFNARRRKRMLKASVIQNAFLWIASCILAFVIGCVLVYYFMTSISCVGQAMEPSIESGNQVLVNRFVYAVTSPKQGDVIVFKPNGNEKSHYYMRRVIGVPGDTVQVKNGVVYVNGELYKTGIGNEQMDFAGLAEEEITLQNNEYFVLGDNRNASEDSRNADIGNIHLENIYGKAWFISYPFENFGMISK